MRVGGEVDGGEGDVTEETGTGALVEADETEVPDNPEGGAARGSTFHAGVFRNFTLDLKANLDDLKGVSEDL